MILFRRRFKFKSIFYTKLQPTFNTNCISTDFKMTSPELFDMVNLVSKQTNGLCNLMDTFYLQKVNQYFSQINN